MTGNLVPDLLTPCAPASLYVALQDVWPTVCGADLRTRNAILVLLSHWALETGWGHFCHRWNIGNYKHTTDDGHEWTMFRCSEIVGGKEVWYDPPHPATRFLAYDTIDEGAIDYLRHLRGRFAKAWPSVLAGDPAAFCHELKLEAYYTAAEGPYTAGVVGCFARLNVEIPADDIPTSPDLPKLLHPDVVADEVTPDDELPKADA